MKAILGILGPSGVGKSAVAVRLAKLLDGEVISTDSMQIYRGMDIGTGKISTCDMDGVHHHMIDVVDSSAAFSAYDFQKMVCEDVFPELEKYNKVPILAGGTGLYYDSVIFGLDNPADDATAMVRQEMLELYQKEGREAVLKVLYEIDKPAFDTIDRRNIKRVIRAIEVAKNGGSLAVEPKKERIARFQHVLCILNKDRDKLYDAADLRVDRMLKDGLVEEVSGLLSSSSIQSMQAIGYKEIADYLKGKTDYDAAVAKIKLNTRHYIKRQLTYFRRMRGAIYIYIDSFDNIDDVAQYIADIYYRNSTL
jgi:tRNA dimethylallyltransferase